MAGSGANMASPRVHVWEQENERRLWFWMKTPTLCNDSFWVWFTKENMCAHRLSVGIWRGFNGTWSIQYSVFFRSAMQRRLCVWLQTIFSCTFSGFFCSFLLPLLNRRGTVNELLLTYWSGGDWVCGGGRRCGGDWKFLWSELVVTDEPVGSQAEVGQELDQDLVSFWKHRSEKKHRQEHWGWTNHEGDTLFNEESAASPTLGGCLRSICRSSLRRLFPPRWRWRHGHSDSSYLAPRQISQT